MRINRYEFNPYSNSLDVYVAGCLLHPCKGCFNRELWDFNNGYEFNNIKDKIDNKLSILTSVKRVFIYGGEPLDQNHVEFISLLTLFKKHNLEIWLFTHYELDCVLPEIKSLVDYIKTGEYVSDLPSKETQYGITLASSNQQLIKLK